MRSRLRMRSLIHALPTFPATLATPQSAAVIAGCDRTLEDEEKRSLIASQLFQQRLPRLRSPSSALNPCLPCEGGSEEVATTAVRNLPIYAISP
ncbi:hypothetical protein [Microcoleus sp. D3_18_C4]|uniref:hypothetical protein n=1 Tax=Microcoleus sp. D3_18_C4 TaxID=3055335 RepID=UPI002FD39304